MVSSNWSPDSGGGAEAYVEDLTTALRARGHEVGAVTLGVDAEDVVATVPARPHRLSEHRASPAWRKAMFHGADVWRPDVMRVLRDAARRFRPDVVHTHVVAGMSVAALTAPSRLGLPHVHTVHDHWLRCWRSTGTTAAQAPCGPACTAVARWRASAVHRSGPDVVIGISQAVLDSHPLLQRDRARMTVIHHPAPAMPPAGPRSPCRTPASNMRSASLGAEQLLELRDGRGSGAAAGTVFGFLGQLNPNKGVDVFLEAARRLAPSGARFVVAGRGRLDAEVTRAGISGLEYRGWVSGAAKDAFFADIDCLVVPSLWQEPAGLVVLEAVARGLPVIASRVGGLPEYVPASCTDLLCTPGDVASLVEKMTFFAAAPEAFPVDPAEASDWPGHVDEIMAAYRRACGWSAAA